MDKNDARDRFALWVKCPDCGRNIDVPPSRLLAFLEYRLTGRYERRGSKAGDPKARRDEEA